MKVYEKPDIKFESLTVFEKIACTDCWSHNKFSFDNPYDKSNCDITIKVREDGKCDLSDSAIAIYKVFDVISWNHEKKFTKQELKYNPTGTNTQWSGFEIKSR